MTEDLSSEGQNEDSPFELNSFTFFHMHRND